MTAEEMPGKIEASLAKKPAGSLSITENGTGIDVSEKATVDVNVPNPSTGSLDITENGNYDVTDYAEVDVEVSGGGEHSGTVQYSKAYCRNYEGDGEYSYNNDYDPLTELGGYSQAGYDGYYHCNGSQMFVGEYSPTRVSEGWYILWTGNWSSGSMQSIGELSVGESIEVTVNGEISGESGEYRFRIERLPDESNE